MNYNVRFIPKFEKELKRLSKKFPSLKGDFALLINSLKQDPSQGRAIGNDCYKLRMAISSKGKGKGKSGGARVITCFKVVQQTVYLLTIFDKSEQESITDKELQELLNYIN